MLTVSTYPGTCTPPSSFPVPLLVECQRHLAEPTVPCDMFPCSIDGATFTTPQALTKHRNRLHLLSDVICRHDGCLFGSDNPWSHAAHENLAHVTCKKRGCGECTSKKAMFQHTHDTLVDCDDTTCFVLYVETAKDARYLHNKMEHKACRYTGCVVILPGATIIMLSLRWKKLTNTAVCPSTPFYRLACRRQRFGCAPRHQGTPLRRAQTVDLQTPPKKTGRMWAKR